jgi:hypothetical protein
MSRGSLRAFAQPGLLTAMDGGYAENAGAIFCRPLLNINLLTRDPGTREI